MTLLSCYLKEKHNNFPGEPHRLVPAKIRRSHNCVYMGGNLLDLGRWRDGPCRWVRHSVHIVHTVHTVPFVQVGQAHRGLSL